jgi:histone deacetylase 1/2
MQDDDAAASSHRRVSYYYDQHTPSKHYGPGHPMKPQRLRLTHELILSYELDRHLDVLQSRPASASELSRFHTADYVDFLQRVAPTHTGTLHNNPMSGTASRHNALIDELASKYNVGEHTDCPLFPGLYEFCQTSCGASIDGAARLNAGEADICINWSGGLHHAKKGEASGFCYANDIVLAILELLRVHARVLYIDIDIHHGDGVEEAFYYSNRVLTCSFHKFGDFFPGTGDLADCGADEGLGYTVNFPLRDGLDDDAFAFCFKPVIDKIMRVYDPGAVVLQCGADSLAGDRLGVFDLSVKGHASAVEFCKSFGKPLLVLGGGGYTINNVARCWAFETAILAGVSLPSSDIPKSDAFYEYYAPTYSVHGLALDRQTPHALGESSVPQKDLNTPAWLTSVRDTILARLDEIRSPPGVQLQDVPPSLASAGFFAKVNGSGGGGGGGGDEDLDA